MNLIIFGLLGIVNRLWWINQFVTEIWAKSGVLTWLPLDMDHADSYNDLLLKQSMTVYVTIPKTVRCMIIIYMSCKFGRYMISPFVVQIRADDIAAI